MNSQKVALTPDQKLIINGLISLLASALSAGMLSMYQYYGTNSTINLGTLIITGFSVFSASFGHGLYAYVPAHVPEETQGIKDIMTDLQKMPEVKSAVPGSTSTAAQAETSIADNLIQAPAGDFTWAKTTKGPIIFPVPSQAPIAADSAFHELISTQIIPTVNTPSPVPVPPPSFAIPPRPASPLGPLPPSLDASFLTSGSPTTKK
jgi:hypothetical protein